MITSLDQATRPEGRAERSRTSGGPGKPLLVPDELEGAIPIAEMKRRQPRVRAPCDHGRVGHSQKAEQAPALEQVIECPGNVAAQLTQAGAPLQGGSGRGAARPARYGLGGGG